MGCTFSSNAQEQMVSFALSKQQQHWLHCACITQYRDGLHEDELVNRHTKQRDDEHKANTKHQHRKGVSGVQAHQRGARVVDGRKSWGHCRVAELQQCSKKKEHDEQQLCSAIERIIAVLSERLERKLQHQTTQ